MKLKQALTFKPASLVLAGLVVGLVGCSDIRHSSFTCDDGRAGSVTWRMDNDTALLSFHGDSWTLFQQPSGSGTRYGDGVREIREHQGTLQVDTGHTETASCHFTNQGWLD